MSPEDRDGGPAWSLATEADGWRRVTPTPRAEALKAFYAQEYFQASHGTYAPAYSDEEVAHRRLLARLLLAAIDESQWREVSAEDHPASDVDEYPCTIRVLERR